MGFLGRWGTHACPQRLPSDTAPVRRSTCHALPVLTTVPFLFGACRYVDLCAVTFNGRLKYGGSLVALLADEKLMGGKPFTLEIYKLTSIQLVDWHTTVSTIHIQYAMIDALAHMLLYVKVTKGTAITFDWWRKMLKQPPIIRPFGGNRVGGDEWHAKKPVLEQVSHPLLPLQLAPPTPSPS